MVVIRFRFTGASPLLMHSERGANPLDKEVQAHKKLTSKRQKTEDDQLEIAFSEYKLAIYHDSEIGPFLPAQNIDRCIQEGAKARKLGKKFNASARCISDRIPLVYEGPREVTKLYESGFVDVRSVGVNRARVMRVRPYFKTWAVEFDFAYDESQIDESDIITAAQTAGNLSGLGDFRPRFGRFNVEVIK